MREKRNHSVRTLPIEPREAKRKFFLVYEGTETEPIYFEGLRRYSAFSKVSPLIEVQKVLGEELNFSLGLNCLQYCKMLLQPLY